MGSDDVNSAMSPLPEPPRSLIQSPTSPFAMWNVYWAAQEECDGESEDEVMDAGDEEDDETCYLTPEARTREIVQWTKCAPCGKPGKVWVDRSGEVMESGGVKYPEFTNCQSVRGHLELSGNGVHDDGFRQWVRLEKVGDEPRSW